MNLLVGLVAKDFFLGFFDLGLKPRAIEKPSMEGSFSFPRKGKMSRFNVTDSVEENKVVK